MQVLTEQGKIKQNQTENHIHTKEKLITRTKTTSPLTEKKNNRIEEEGREIKRNAIRNQNRAGRWK